MKKKFFALVLLIALLIPSLALAAAPNISSDSRSFNPFTGVYELKGNVSVDFGERVITADAAQGSLFTLIVDAQGNVKLKDTKYNITFACDSVKVKAGNREADCYKRCVFTSGDTTITSDHGHYNWKTRVAEFDGSVTVNGKKRSGIVAYDVEAKTLK